MTAHPVQEAERIQSLDVLRGFALLGILLLNILGFGLLSPAYSYPGFDLAQGTTADITAWATVELLAEGAMRCLFSMLFGAGVILFTTGVRGKSGGLHYRRTFWLLAFGLFDAYVLLWNGDILVTYALAGALLYVLRNARPRTLLVLAGTLIVLMSLVYALSAFGLSLARDAAQAVADAADPSTLDAATREAAEQWTGFQADYVPPSAEVAQELAARTDSYATAFAWNVERTNEMLLFVLPVVLFWDALAMMLLGMALYRYGVLQGERAPAWYFRLMIAGFAIGLTTNAYEVNRAIASGFDLFAVFAQLQPTYHIGRLGMAMGYIGLLLWISHRGTLARLRGLLAAVGRMALTNYLMHSLICLVLFTGAGFALLGQLSRAELYPVVLAIWLFQMFFSSWWLARYRFGPLEWLWRALTYGERPPLARAERQPSG